MLAPYDLLAVCRTSPKYNVYYKVIKYWTFTWHAYMPLVLRNSLTFALEIILTCVCVTSFKRNWGICILYKDVIVKHIRKIKACACCIRIFISVPEGFKVCFFPYIQVESTRRVKAWRIEQEFSFVSHNSQEKDTRKL